MDLSPKLRPPPPARALTAGRTTRLARQASVVRSSQSHELRSSRGPQSRAPPAYFFAVSSPLYQPLEARGRGSLATASGTMSNLNDLLGDSLATLGLKQAQKQTLGAMKMQAPAQTRPAPVGMAPMSPAPMFPGTPGPTPAMPRNDFDPFAPMPSPQTGMRPPMAAPPPKAVPHAGSASGNLDDLLGNMDLGARQRDSASNLMGCVSPVTAADCLRRRAPVTGHGNA